MVNNPDAVVVLFFLIYLAACLRNPNRLKILDVGSSRVEFGTLLLACRLIQDHEWNVVNNYCTT